MFLDPLPSPTLRGAIFQTEVIDSGKKIKHKQFNTRGQISAEDKTGSSSLSHSLGEKLHPVFGTSLTGQPADVSRAFFSLDAVSLILTQAMLGVNDDHDTFT